ncbi:MAG: hypothetical protein EU550_00060 [Promethearchaeota archaeon]|nr:MAG: hypothetical protein EU550_00060 [Candidatus Lokiarchaeota archaeon]
MQGKEQKEEVRIIVVVVKNFKEEIDITKNKEKLKVDIYVPLQVCACEWENFMNRVFEVLTPYAKYIEHDTKSLNSEKAAKMNLFEKCVIIDGEKKISSVYRLKTYLPKILQEKGFSANE